MQRAFIIFMIVLLLAGFGIVAYFYFFADSASVVVAPGGTTSLPIAGKSPGTGVGGTPGAPGTPGAGTTASSTPSTPRVPVTVSARLVKISAGPVVPGEAAITMKSANASSSPDVAVSYVERQSGNVFTYLMRAKTLTRTSNRTIPGIESAIWFPNASTTLVRYLSGPDFSTINTYALPANGSNGFFLPQNLTDIAVSSTSILMLASGVNGSVASLARPDGSHVTAAFTTPLAALRVSFAGKNRYLAFTKPSGELAGDAFLVDSAGHFSRIAGPLNGLVALASPSGKWAAVSYTLNDALQMELVNTATGETLPLPVATIADKCVWTADESALYCGVPANPPTGVRYPDDWYQGAVTFSDRIWKIQVAGRYAQLVLDFSKETNGSLDMIAPAIDAANISLVFMNKNDGSLWIYSL